MSAVAADEIEKTPWAMVILLGSLTAFAAISIDMYLPSLPAISAGFHAPPGAAQATLATFFAGLAISLVRPLHLDGQITPAIIAGLFVGSSGLTLIVNGGMYVVGHMLHRKPPAHRHPLPMDALAANPVE